MTLEIMGTCLAHKRRDKDKILVVRMLLLVWVMRHGVNTRSVHSFVGHMKKGAHIEMDHLYVTVLLYKV